MKSMSAPQNTDTLGPLRPDHSFHPSVYPNPK